MDWLDINKSQTNKEIKLVMEENYKFEVSIDNVSDNLLSSKTKELLKAHHCDKVRDIFLISIERNSFIFEADEVTVREILVFKLAFCEEYINVLKEHKKMREQLEYIVSTIIANRKNEEV